MYIQSLLLHVFNSWYTHFGLLTLGQQHGTLVQHFAMITNLGSISTMSNMFYSCFIVICAYRFDHIKLHFTVEKKKREKFERYYYFAEFMYPKFRGMDKYPFPVLMPGFKHLRIQVLQYKWLYIIRIILPICIFFWYFSLDYFGFCVHDYFR